MRRTEMLWFDDVSALNEPVLSFPVLGRLSMRQFFILGVSAMASYALFSGTHGIISAIPACIGALFTFVKPKVGSPEWLGSSIVLFLACRLAGKMSVRAAMREKPRASCKLGLPEPLVVLSGKDRVRLLVLSGLSKFGLGARHAGKGRLGTATRKSGKKRITVYVEDQEEPAFSRVIEVRDMPEAP